LRSPDTQTLDEMYASLDCNPDTGELLWLRSFPRANEGTRAGTRLPSGRIVVGFKKRSYPAAMVAWFLHHNEWPEWPINFRDGDPTNLSKANLVPRPATWRSTAHANRMRRYREGLRQRTNTKKRDSAVPYVTKSVDGVTWFARAERDRRIVLGMFDNPGAAELLATTAAKGYAFVTANPPPDLPGPTAGLTAGPGGGDLTLADAHALFAYDPTTGRFYHRHPAVRAGVPAENFTPTGRPYLRAAARKYGAGMLAWFMTHHYWPARRQIGYRDGNMSNTALANLYLKGHE
jgi:hypothetical protein